MIDPESNRILELARSARTPSDADKAAVERRLATALGLWAGTSAATAAAASGSKAGAGKLAASAALKWWVAGASALIGAGALGYVALRTPAAEPSRAQVAAGRVPAAPIEPAQATIAPPSAPAVPGPAVVHEPQPLREQPVTRTAQRPARKERVRTVAPGAQADEVELLHRAQSAWRSGQSRAALDLLEQHRTRFAHSSLRSERDALRALSLCELGRRDEASALARQVLTRDPSTPLRPALEAGCLR